MRFRVIVELETPLAASEEDAQFSLPWTDVVGPEGDISIIEAEEIGVGEEGHGA